MEKRGKCSKTISGETTPYLTKLFTNISETLCEGIFRCRSDKGLEFANSALSNLFGYSDSSDILSLPAKAFFVNHADLARCAAQLNRNRSLRNETLQLKRKNGTTFWGLVNCTLTIDGGHEYIDGAVIDITEKKQSEELLTQKNEELKKLHKQMDKFLYSASHDLRAPMTSIMGISNILRMEIDKSKHIYLDKIDTSIQSLSYFIEEVKEFSENACRAIDSKRIDFNKILNAAWRSSNGVNSAIKFSMREMGESMFYSDPQRLQIILGNLLKNCVQYYNPEHEAPFVHVLVQHQTDKIYITVEDNGQGIASSQLPKIFNMFYRANESSRGSGMGLYIVKETVEKLKGTVNLHSIFGEGTSVVIEIPNDVKGRLMSKKWQISRMPKRNHYAI